MARTTRFAPREGRSDYGARGFRGVGGALWVLGFGAGLPSPGAAQAIDSAGRDLSSLDIDELARIRVTAVARRPEAVVQSSAAVTVNPGLNPQHQVGLWASFDLPGNLELDMLGRYVSRLDVEPEIEDYLQADIQLGGKVGNHLQVALIGRDLLAARHSEFPQSGFVPERRAITRQLRGKASWAF